MSTSLIFCLPFPTTKPPNCAIIPFLHGLKKVSAPHLFATFSHETAFFFIVPCPNDLFTHSQPPFPCQRYHCFGCHTPFPILLSPSRFPYPPFPMFLIHHSRLLSYQFTFRGPTLLRPFPTYQTGCSAPHSFSLPFFVFPVPIEAV